MIAEPWVLSGLCAFVLPSANAYAGLGTYFKDYRATVEWKTGGAKSDLKYDTVRSAELPDGCIEKKADPGLMSCSTQLGDTSKPYYAIGLQQIFKRQGFWYFGADFGGSAFVLDAMARKDAAITQRPQPIQKARVHLYGMNLRGYLQFGITPAAIWPDLLLSAGLGGHASTGNLKVNDLREKVSIATRMSYAQFEAVWWRFKDGSLSSYISTESGGSHRLKGDYGKYTNLSLHPSLVSFGVLKLVLPWGSR
jgi:hypothetical protein